MDFSSIHPLRNRCMAAFCSSLALAASASAVEPVTLRSLLAEMTDFTAVARWPEPEFTCLQSSSHDRRTVSPDQPGWFANDDHTQFIREETNDGRRERVMMDAEGPGCLVRFWLTTVENKRGVLRIYLDGGKEPTLVFPAYDLLSGDLNLFEPIAQPHPGYTATGNGGNTLALPIPYARGCKVTWEEQGSGPRYYKIEHRKYPPGTRVETFTRASLDSARSAVRETGKTLLSPPIFAVSPLVRESTIPAGGETTLDLPPGPSSIRYLELRLDPASPGEMSAALRSTIIRMKFDGVETVWCPVGDFFGSGAGLNELRSFYRTVQPDGTLVCRWVMPYRKSAGIIVENVGSKTVGCSLRCETDAWKWDDRSMHFHVGWHHEQDLRTPPARDWNFARLKGRGVLVGDVLSLYNKVSTWYGEGDEKIRVDGEKVPSHIGTGTEDYYNYSFAPRGIIQGPFANQIRVDEPNTQGHNVLARSRNLDTIPFRESLDFDIELISWKPTRMIYSATTCWYAFPGGSSNLKPDVAGAIARIPSLEDARKPPAAFPDVLDAEVLGITSKSDGLVTEKQGMGDYGADLWSRGEQLLGRASDGSFVELEIPVPDNKPHQLILAATKAPDYGTLSFRVNGKPVKTGFDGYSPAVVHGGEVALGTFTPENGKLTLRVAVSGSNPEATGPRFYFGIDYVKLSPPGF